MRTPRKPKESNGHVNTGEEARIGQALAKHKSEGSLSRYHVDHWKERVYRKTFTRDGELHEVNEFSIRLMHLGRREAFSLGTNNANAAAAKAKEIATFLEANGWEATLAKWKPSPLVKAAVCTVGEFLTDVEKRSHLKPGTVRQYSIKLRKIVSDVKNLQAGLRGKAAKRKYDYRTGGRAEFLAKVDRQPLDVLTPDSIASWQNQYIAKAGNDPIKRRSAERSAASILRCSRALFSREVLARLKVKLPANPFEGVKIKDPGPQRYNSQVNPELLLILADRELRSAQPQVFLALFLCLYAGLRRKEADLLLWEQVDLKSGQIEIRRTWCMEPKTEESARTIDLSPSAVAVLREVMAKSTEAEKTSQFVLEGGEPDLAATYAYYRCDHTWRTLLAWLKSKGVKATKAIHAMRKESGSLIASDFGIEAARHHLGHRDIRTTSAHYVSKKKRLEINIPISAGLVAVGNG